MNLEFLITIMKNIKRTNSAIKKIIVLHRLLTIQTLWNNNEKCRCGSTIKRILTFSLHKIRVTRKKKRRQIRYNVKG